MSIPRLDYIVGQIPTSIDSIIVFLSRELPKISNAIGLLSENIYTELNAEPDKPQNGQTAYADGTNWNPGSGRGLYIYKSGTGWVFLG